MAAKDIFGSDVLLAALRNTSATEWVAVATGIVYVLLIMRRNRWGWVFGGISSSLFVVLCLRSRLPMQALLQASYVAGAVYGWWSWAPQSQPDRVSVWTLKGHVLAIAGCVLLSFGLRSLLAGESAFPLMDSLVACLGLLATWLMARVKLENWAYWIALDVVSVYLYLSQGLVVTAGLFLIYMTVASAGLNSWWRLWRSQSKGAAVP